MSLLTIIEQKDLQNRHMELIKLAYEVRVLQKRYFKSRSSLTLEEAKKKEKLLDALIDKEIEVTKVEQARIF
jgi:hypothetical protein